MPQRNLRLQFTHQVSLSQPLVHWLETATHPDLNRRFLTATDALQELLHPQPLLSHEASTFQWQTSAVFASQPQESRVRIQQSPEHLTIALNEVDNRPFLVRFVFLVGLAIFLLVGFSWYAPAIVFVFSPPLIAFVCVSLKVVWTTRIVLDQSQFSIYRDPIPLLKSFLKSRRNVVKPLRNIQAVIQHTVMLPPSRNVGTQRVITIQTRDQDFPVGRGLRKDECIWIVQTIQRWLAASSDA
ncbi:MAG: hypothetical protein AAGH78_08130 [Cyanobacteria bacterium P01_H01_bin.58]